jgi:hypothetical protein
MGLRSPTRPPSFDLSNQWHGGPAASTTPSIPETQSGRAATSHAIVLITGPQVATFARVIWTLRCLLQFPARQNRMGMETRAGVAFNKFLNQSV